MEVKECVAILRSFLRHRTHMHGKEVALISDDGFEEDSGYFSEESDILYQAVKFALDCVENHFS